MTCRISSIPGNLLLVVLASSGTGVGYGEESRVTLAESCPTNWLLLRPVPSYQNYAFDTYDNYLQTTFPQAEQPGLVENFYPRALYDVFGDHVFTGYDLLHLV